MPEADRSREKGEVAEGGYGLECPRCGCNDFHVLSTRRTSGGKLIRRRQCRYCGRRMTTYESQG